MAQKLISQGTLKTNFGMNNRPILALNVVTIICKNFCQSGCFLRNSRLLKISLLQPYEVLWIHNIDVICKYCRIKSFYNSFPFFYSPPFFLNKRKYCSFLQSMALSNFASSRSFENQISNIFERSLLCFNINLNNTLFSFEF